MPELMEISGLSDDAQKPAPAETKTEPAKSSDWSVLLIFGGIALGVFLLKKFLPLKPKSTEVIGTFRYKNLSDVGMIKRCPKKNKTKARPAKDQKYCLFTKSGKRLLGRHPSRTRALKQERLIEMKKRV